MANRVTSEATRSRHESDSEARIATLSLARQAIALTAIRIVAVATDSRATLRVALALAVERDMASLYRNLEPKAKPPL